MNDPLTSFNRWLGKKLPMSQTIWLKRLRREEHPWQRRQRELQRHLSGIDAAEATLMLGGSPVTVVSRGYDSIQAVTVNLARVVDTLRSQGIEFVQLPDFSPYRPILVVRQPDLHATLDALTALHEADGWSIGLEDEDRRALSLATARRRPERVFRIVVSRPIIGQSGHLMSTPSEGVVIEPWEQVGEGEPRADGTTYIAGTVRRRLQRRGTYLEYLSPEVWEQAVSGADHVARWQAPHLFQVTEPIDLVYTWVDGDDPEWQARKQQASGLIDHGTVNETALNASRFTNRDELKYSLRSVEAYANWVNHIYIVTDRQVPAWLNTDHPKITIVDHREIFSDPSVLPVFNSHAIESQLHHIPGLSERYLYMNDDVFLMRPVRPEQFFTSNGLSKFFPSRAPLDIHEASPRDLPVLSAAKHGREFMVEHHGRTVTNKFKHTPQPQLRSVLQEMEAEHPDMFRQVAASTFRAPEDYSIPSALFHFHAYAKRRAVVGAISYDYVDIASPDAALRLEWFSFQKKLEVICLNDTALGADDHEQVSNLLGDFLDRRFSIASSFER